MYSIICVLFPLYMLIILRKLNTYTVQQRVTSAVLIFNIFL